MPSPRRLVLAVNPHASFGSRAGAGSRVASELTALGHDVTVLRAESLDALRTACAAELAGSGVDAFVVVGGDGMVHLGAALVAGTGTPLGIVPTGTGNDLARGLGLPLDDLEAAVRVLDERLRNGARRIDAATATRGGEVTWFAGVLSAGFDAIVNERANRMRRPRGKSRYSLAILRELIALSPVRYDLVVDGVARTERAVLVSVANNTSLGGGMTIAPDARLDDGLLDLFIVQPLGRLAFLRVFPKVFAGRHTHLPQVSLERVGTVEIRASGIVAYADGERIGALPVRVDVVPGALLVLA